MRTRPAGRLAAAVAAFLAGLAGVVGAQERPVAQEKPPSAADAGDLVNAVLGGLLGFKEVTGPELQEEVATVGGVPFRAPVPLDYLAPAELQRYLKDVLDTEYPPERAQSDARMLVAFGLVPPGTPLRDLRARVLEDNVVGFYDERPGHKRLYAVSADRALTPANQLVLSHELRHALQDQYADVHAVLPESVGDFDDRRMAFITLLEGDATLVMERFLTSRLRESGLGTSDLSDLAWPTPPVPGVPPVLRDQLVLPYVVGRDFARALQSRGGWAALRAAWSRPPASTEQVLHPEKFLAGEAPRTVSLAWAPAGGRLVNEGVLGEMLARTLLAGPEEADPGAGGPAGPSAEAVEQAAAGWGGDLYRVWDVGGRTVLVWRTEWDSPADLREFADALRGRFEATHGPRRPGRGADVYAKGGWSFGVVQAADAVTLVSSDDAPAFDKALAAVAGKR